MGCQADLVSTLEPASEVATVVENPLELSSKVEVKEVVKSLNTSFTKAEELEPSSGAGCENSTSGMITVMLNPEWYNKNGPSFVI